MFKLIECFYLICKLFDGNTTFNNMSVISWQSDLLVEESTALPQDTDKLYHIILYTLSWSRFELTTSVVIGTDGIGSCKSNYHTITVTTAPICQLYYFSSDVVYVISTEQVFFWWFLFFAIFAFIWFCVKKMCPDTSIWHVSH